MFRRTLTILHHLPWDSVNVSDHFAVFCINALRVDIAKSRSSHQRCSITKAVVKHFAIFTGKHLPAMPATLLKRDFNTVVFLWILQNFYEQLFCKKPPMAASK